MNRSIALLLISIVLLLIIAVWTIGSALIGYTFGWISRNSEVATLSADLATQTARADGEVATLASLRDTLKLERDKHARMRQAADAELADRATRIANLTVAAERRQNELKKKAATDEDCAALRDLPVCAAVADRLWGEPATGSPH